MRAEDVIKAPLMLTEKGNLQREKQNTYLFEVDRRANKIDIRNAVETLFSVGVVEVRTMLVRGHMRRMGRGYAKTKNWKKAMVVLKSGESINLAEGV